MSCPVIEATSSNSQNNDAFIVIGFKTIEKTYNRVFEEHWKDLTGARSVYLNLSPKLGLNKISFLKRIRPADLNTYVYILNVSLTNATDQNSHILVDFVQRLRLRMLGFVAVYKGYQNM
jgi:hypothetical protein